MIEDSRVRKIIAGDTLLAHVYDFDKPGQVIFPTPDAAEMQCGFGQVDEDKLVKPHVHNTVERKTFHTSEFIYVISGQLDIEFLDERGVVVGEAVIGPGQGFLQFAGGHKIWIHANTRYFELKQGPYLGVVNDKTILEDHVP